MLKTSFSLRTLAVATTLTLSASAMAQDTLKAKTSEREIRDQVLSQIDEQRTTKSDSLAKEIQRLTEKISQFDKELNQTGDANRKIKTLSERVQVIEARQAAVSEDELNVYQANYQSAVINLISMERELKPLILFNAARDFYGSITNVSNPTTYPGYQEWYKKYRDYLNNQKGTQAKARIISSVLDVANDLTKGSPLTGTFTNALFTGVDMIMQSTDKKLKDLQGESEKMMTLSLVLSQFTQDKDLIETEWESINAELEELQKLYDTSLRNNLKLLNINYEEFNTRFTKENDALRRTRYLNELLEIISKQVAAERADNIKSWKETFYYEMTSVQSLKVRFGQITFRISENTARYNDLINKYSANPIIGTRVAVLKGKLQSLQDAFDKEFQPLEYIKSATKMYKVD